jgi:hypothetical protein
MDEKIAAAEIGRRRRRRWYQFRLRTSLIAVVIAAIPCGYVGSQARIVRQRNEVQRAWEDRGAMFCFSDSNPPSYLRRRFGDMSAFLIWVPACDSRERKEIEAVFPEAEISVGGKRPIFD